MKRILALLLAAALIFGLAACKSGPKPEDTVKKFFDAMKAYDFEAMQACVDGEFDPKEMISTEEDDPTGLFDYLKGNAANITYKTGTVEINDKTAKVPVTVEYTDATDVISQTFADYFTARFSMLFSNSSEEEVEKALSDALQKAIAEKETGIATKEMTLDMVLTGEEWKLAEMPKDEIADILTSNMISALENMEDIFNSEDFDWGGDDPVEYPIADAVLFDNESAKITVQSGGCDEWGNISFDVLCENKTEQDLTFRLENLIVNGWSVGGSLYADVAAGESSTANMDIWASDMELIGIENPDRVTAEVQIYNEDDWWNDIYLVREEATFYPTELDDSEIVVPERPSADGEIVLADDDNFTMVLLDSKVDELWGGFSIRAYVKNKSDRKLYVDWDEVSLNGVMIDPYCGMTIPAGQQTMTEISFAVNEMQDAGIETVETVEFNLRAMDDATNEELFNQTMTYQP